MTLVQMQSYLDPEKPPAKIVLTQKTMKHTATCPKCNTQFQVTLLGRPSDRTTRHQLKQAVSICTFDMYKMGKIYRWRCPSGCSEESLSYRYQKSDGVHVWCEVCGKTSHFDEVHFKGSDEQQEP